MSDLYTYESEIPVAEGGNLVVDLNGLLFDGVTPHGDDGVVYCWQAIDGWFDTADLTVNSIPLPIGIQHTVVKLGGRPITLTGVAHYPDGTPLDAAAYAAMRYIKTFCRAEFGPIELIVYEPDLPLRALVRQTGPARFIVQAASGRAVSVKFQVPLVATDPRRYSLEVKSFECSPDTNNVTNEGDMPTPVIIRQTGPATSPWFQNHSAAGEPTLAMTTTYGAVDLTIDTLTEEVDINGFNFRSSLTTAQWWMLVPGDNIVEVSHTCTLEYRDAYS